MFRHPTVLFCGGPCLCHGNVKIVNPRGLREHDHDYAGSGARGPVLVREGIVIVPKGAVIPDGTNCAPQNRIP